MNGAGAASGFEEIAADVAREVTGCRYRLVETIERMAAGLEDVTRAAGGSCAGLEGVAEGVLRFAYECVLRLVGTDHPTTACIGRRLGRLLLGRLRPYAAYEPLRVVWTEARSRLGPDHPATLLARIDMLECALSQGSATDYRNLRGSLDECAVACARMNGDYCAVTKRAVALSACSLAWSGDWAAALSELHDADVESMTPIHGDAWVSHSRLAMAACQCMTGSASAAVPALRTLISDIVDGRVLMFPLARVCYWMARSITQMLLDAPNEAPKSYNAELLREAEMLLSLALSHGHALHHPGADDMHVAAALMGQCALRVGVPSIACAWLRFAHDAFATQFGPDSPKALTAAFYLVDALLADGKTQEASVMARASTTVARNAHGEDNNVTQALRCISHACELSCCS